MELSGADTRRSPAQSLGVETFNPVNGMQGDSDDDESSLPTPTPAVIDETKILNEMEYVFSATFDDWILKYGTLSDQDLVKQGHTFVDEDGILRYTHNWMPVDLRRSELSPTSIRTELQETGCLRVPVILHHVEPEDPNVAAPKHKIVNISFLMNFRALWDYFKSDDTDELIEYAPLYRKYVELFFHPFTSWFLLLVAGYELLVHIVVDSVFLAYPASLIVLNDAQLIFEVLFYLKLVHLFKGSSLSAPSPVLKREPEVHPTPQKKRRHDHRKFTLHWTLSLKKVVSHSIREFFSLCERSSHHKEQDNSKVEQVPFYELLNTSLKFLNKHSNNVCDKLQLNKKSHNIKLLMILCFLPLYYIIVTYLPPTSPYAQYMNICDEDGTNSARCVNSRWTFILSLGYATYIIRRYIFASAVVLSLMGLNFGAEVAHSLTDSWIYRFGPLRRLAVQQADTNADNNCTIDGSEAPFNSGYSIKSVVSTTTGRKTLEQKMALSTPMKNLNKVRFGAVNASEVLTYVQRDSYEHYLFIREYMAIASRAWSGPILTFAFFAIFLMVTFSFLLVMYIKNVTPLEWVYYTIWMAIRLFILIIHPILSLAHANAYVYALREQFLVAAPEDFAALGGRDAWLDYLEKVPAIWSVYGLWVTWERLTGVVWTLAAGLGAIVISIVSADL